jgi:hypothetical protein
MQDAPQKKEILKKKNPDQLSSQKAPRLFNQNTSKSQEKDLI